MRENVSKGVDPVLVVSPWTIHGQTDLLKYARSSNKFDLIRKIRIPVTKDIKCKDSTAHKQK
jgi:hypothetical protein